MPYLKSYHCCSFCNSNYDTSEEALYCESRHAGDGGIILASYIKTDFYPHTIKVGFPGNALVTYIKSYVEGLDEE